MIRTQNDHCVLTVRLFYKERLVSIINYITDEHVLCFHLSSVLASISNLFVIPNEDIHTFQIQNLFLSL